MLQAYIVDDEAPARSRLRKLLKPLVDGGRVKVIGEAADGFEALAALEKQGAELLFLDINMPELDGFGVLERLSPENRPFVVFTTAFDEYAIKAFEANAVDYLLKPISRKRLEEAVARVESLSKGGIGTAQSDERMAQLLDWLDEQAEAKQPASGPTAKEYLKQMSIPYRDRILIVPVERLLSIEIAEGITRLHVLEEQDVGPKRRIRQHIVSYTLEQLEARLDPAAFMRVHRSAIVQLGHITEMMSWFSGRYKLILTGGHEVIASRERSKQLKERLTM
jgi:two-component system LytT family response regulator